MMKKIKKFLMLMFLAGQFTAQAQDGLFISEIADPGDEYTGRFIELFNAGSETVDFGTTVMYLTRQSNGGTTWGTVQLTGTVAPGRTYVIGGSAFESHYGFAPDLVTGILTGNGDDPYSLYIGGNHETGSLHDIYGETNTDGTGEAWEYTDSRAVRDAFVDSPGTLWFSSEWTIAPAGIADCDPGTHNGSPGGGPVTPVGDFAIYAGSDTVEYGEPFQLGILVSELLASDDIISFQLDIAYDPSLLEYAYASVIGTIADGGTLAENNAQAGEVSISYMNTDPLIGSGEILWLTFTTLGMGSTDVALSNAFLNNLSVTELYSGTVLVSESTPPAASITYSDTINRLSDVLQITAAFSEEMDPATPVHLEMSGAVTETALEMVRVSATEYSYLYFIPRAGGTVNVSFSNGTDMNGNPVVAAPTEGSTFDIIPIRPGDVNDDGVVQAYDAALALQHSVGLDPIPEADPLPWEPWRDSTANIDGQGGITAYDAGLILQYSAGIESFTGTALKTLYDADVRVEQVGKELIFYSSGTLVGLNVTAQHGGDFLGTPTFLLEEHLTAVNMNGETYKVGLCTAYPPGEETAIMRIPVNHPGQLTLNLGINDRLKKIAIDLTTAVSRYAEKTWSVYPNPAHEILYIEGVTGPAAIEIFDLQGRSRISSSIEGAEMSIDLGRLERGTYLIRIDVGDHSMQEKFLVQ